MIRIAWAALAVLLAGQTAPASPTAADARKTVVDIVRQIQRADYEGNRPALRQLFDRLAPFVATPEIGSRVRYWRGFALWRRSLNGFNEPTMPPDLEADLTEAVAEFKAALAIDPAWIDAKVGLIGCLQNLTFLALNDPARANALVAEFVPLLGEVRKAAPDNPRVLWILGASQWYNPPERGGGRALALATYARGLDLARKARGREHDPLDPSWGEPEILMNLAWSNLNATPPDVAAAERYAREALALVPYWHYVRDILLVQIGKAKTGRYGHATPSPPFAARSTAARGP